MLFSIPHRSTLGSCRDRLYHARKSAAAALARHLLRATESTPFSTLVPLLHDVLDAL
jgi:hypothetical protein